ncbi:SDR family oxidoreductase [Hoeflea sp. WL0058]|uniref:SDR family oxidoreductase n=1 Tax=Flavimaribacter sediminis TaxID=2865987 RepID=A0AAE2ZMZ9_9HYPH|nr:SDR family NAD(P)-dependent oxidoreductase [Flavimaribacter sediminis]MBW8637510.1 SDR family oxidoreductase [Flavimaribacter sediminis]
MTKDPNSLEGRVAWITGSGRGMGSAHAKLMAERGADIVVHDVLEDEAKETAEAIQAMGRKVLLSTADIRDAAAMRDLVKEVEAKLGPVDILVNNAGIGEHAEIEEITPEKYQRMFDIHVRGSFFCGQAVIPGMKERKYGRIVNISSIWGMNGHHTASHYCAAKTAVLGLTKAWAKELAPWNILVNAVCPGGVLTEMPIRVQGMEKIREKEKKVPLGRWAAPEEISYAVVYFAAPTGDFVTGQAISPNGGETIVGF